MLKQDDILIDLQPRPGQVPQKVDRVKYGSCARPRHRRRRRRWS